LAYKPPAIINSDLILTPLSRRCSQNESGRYLLLKRSSSSGSSPHGAVELSGLILIQYTNN